MLEITMVRFLHKMLVDEPVQWEFSPQFLLLIYVQIVDYYTTYRVMQQVVVFVH